jgi:[acyl-carrier-protein] S-malonyltransferase
LVTNVDATPIQHPDDLRRELLDQICASVRWIDVVERLHRDGVHTFIEVGPGKVLSGLIGRIARGAQTVAAEDLLTQETEHTP